MTFEVARIHFLSDVLVAVAVESDELSLQTGVIFSRFPSFSGKSSKLEGGEGVRHARRGKALASHAGVFGGARLSSLPTQAFFRGARLSSLPTNACSTENNIPFPNLANHIVL